MTSVIQDHSLETTEHKFAHNLIDGRWLPAASTASSAFRSPLTGNVVAAVPSSSEADVEEAVRAARSALARAPRSRATRVRNLRCLLEELASREEDLAALQSLESGLTFADSLATVHQTIAQSRSLLSCGAVAQIPEIGGVSGHILSWGLPFTEMLSSMLPALLAGDAIVVKPSSRAPLSPVAIAHVAHLAGLCPGLLNIIQGTGESVGAELIGRSDLSGLYVRGGPDTLQAARTAGTGVPLKTVRAGGNLVAIGYAAMPRLPAIARAIGNLVRMGSAGGPLALPLVAVQRSCEYEVLAALIVELGRMESAPLPDRLLERRAQARVRSLTDAGATTVLTGSPDLCEIGQHQGCQLSPTLLRLGSVASPATRALIEDPPAGPALSVATFEHAAEISEVLDPDLAEGGVAWLCGIEPGDIPLLPQGAVVTEPLTGDLGTDIHLAPAWFRGLPIST